MSKLKELVIGVLLCTLCLLFSAQASHAQSCSASVIATVNTNLDMPGATGDDVLEIDLDDNGAITCAAKSGNANTAFNARMEVSHCSTATPTDLCFVVDRADALTAASISGPGLVGAVSPADDAEVDLSAGTYDVTATVDGTPVGFSFTILENAPDDQRILASPISILVGTPEINLSSSTTGPLSDDGVDDQGTVPAGVMQTITYSITNSGPGELTLIGTPTVTGETNIDDGVAISAPGTQVIAAGGTTTFTATFRPALAGAFGFDIDVVSDDADEGIFDISVIGNATGDPDILVTSSESGSISDGGTDVHASISVGDAQTVTYTIQNGGADTLILTGAPSANNLDNIAGNVQISTPGSLSLAPTESTSFDVIYSTARDGAFGFDLNLASNDPDTAVFDIAVRGSSNAGPTVVLSGPGASSDASFLVAATFSEPVDGVELLDFALVNATVADLTAVSASVYTILVTPVIPSDAVSISVPAGGVTDVDGAPNAASSVLTINRGVLSTAQRFEVRDAAIQQTTAVLRSSLDFSQRANRDARNRFVDIGRCQGQLGEDHQATECDRRQLTRGAVPLQFNADVQATRSGIDALGGFYANAPTTDGGNRLIFGEFAVQQDEDGNVTGSFNGRVAWEYMHGSELMTGYFVGARVNQTDLSGTLSGDGTSRGVSVGTYFVNALGENLFWDGFIAVGAGTNNLDLSGDAFDASSDYRTQTLQLGLAVAGTKAYSGFAINPELSLAYGVTEIGDVTFDVAFAGNDMTDVVDAGQVEIGLLRFRPEFVFQDERIRGSELRIAPSLLCRYVSADETDQACGGGLEVEWSFTAQDGSHAISTRVSREVIGAAVQDSLAVQFELTF